jgi:autotransporter translocation and assembly factor TamB
LSVSGKLALKPDDTNDLAVMGRADLRVFSGFLREWRLRGAATLRSQIGGSPGALRVSGGLDIEEGALRLRAFPQGLDGLSGRIVFNETQARVAGMEGRFGGGRVSVSGQMGFGASTPPTFDFSFTGDSLGLRYPEGLRSTFGASLRLQGTTESHWLTGSLTVSKALWTRRYAITSDLFSAQSSSVGFSRAASDLKPSAMRLDIAIKAPGTLRLDNNLASVVARADLSLGGSPSAPQLLGRVEVERGKVFFGGNTYDVRKGVAHFSNPRKIDPVFEIEAEARLRSYRLTLQANGTMDQVSTRITSDPPLTSPQIATLLAGGNENEVANTGGSGTSATDLKTLGAGGVNTLAGAWLGDNVTDQVAQGFGLSRLSIDPGLLTRAGARLTVGKRITPDLDVVYSRTLSGGTENQLVAVEYSLSNRFSLVVSWAEPEGFGADVRTRITLGR